MYKSIIRKILFKFDPEKVHYFSFSSIKFLCKLPFVSKILRRNFLVNDPLLETEVFGLKFRNPVGIAAGFDKNAVLIDELETLGFGFIEIGTLTPDVQQGNPKPRLFRLKEDEAIINRMGFNNDGVDEAVKKLKNRNSNILIGGNIGKNNKTPDQESKPDFLYSFEALYDYVDYFVVNVSCPNVGNSAKLQDKDFLIDLLSTLKAESKSKTVQKPILIKVAPYAPESQLDEIIEIVSESELDGVVATNTEVRREGLKASDTELEKIGKGGLSGKPIKNNSTQVIKYLHEKSGGAFPIIGVGGINSPEDALEKLEAGASLVQIYTGFVYNGPALVKNINQSILDTRK